MSMDAKRLEEIRERCAKASPAEHWSARDMDLAEVCGQGWWADAVFAEKARTDVPDLLAEVERLRAERGEARKHLRAVLPYAESRIEDIADCEDDAVSAEDHRVSLERARATYDSAYAFLNTSNAGTFNAGAQTPAADPPSVAGAAPISDAEYEAVVRLTDPEFQRRYWRVTLPTADTGTAPAPAVEVEHKHSWHKQPGDEWACAKAGCGARTTTRPETCCCACGDEDGCGLTPEGFCEDCRPSAARAGEVLP